MAMSSPPVTPLPPRRTARRPFITAFLEYVLPFADAASLVACGAVSRAWHVEAESPALWRRLCESTTGSNGTLSSSSVIVPLSVPEMKRMALRHTKCASEAPVQPCNDTNVASAQGITDDVIEPSARREVSPTTTSSFVLVKQDEGDTIATTTSLFSAGLQYRIQRTIGQSTTVLGSEAAPIGYECASPVALLEQRIAALKRAVQTLLQNAVAEQTSAVRAHEAAVANLRRLCPSDTALALRRQCRQLLSDMHTFETIATQAVLHGSTSSASSSSEATTKKDKIHSPAACTAPADADVCEGGISGSSDEAESEKAVLRHARAICSFVQLELLLVSHALPATRRRWRRLQACMPIDDHYYDLLDALQTNETKHSKQQRRRRALPITSAWLEQSAYANIRAKLATVLARQTKAGRRLSYDELMQCIM